MKAFIKRHPRLLSAVRSPRNWVTRTFLWPRRRKTLFLWRTPASLRARPAIAKGDTQDDRQIVQRVIAAYQRTGREFRPAADSIWRLFFEESHQNVHQLVMDGKLESVAAVLRRPGDSELFCGFDPLHLSYPCKPAVEALVCLDGLVRFAEALGIRRLFNPEEYTSNDALRPSMESVDSDTVVHEIEAALRIPLSLPNPFPGECGVLTSRGVASNRVPGALYQSWRIKQLVGGLSAPRVLEIGAGLGRTAYYARQLGILDYSIVDIPFTSISQGYFLGRTLGDDAVLLAGETAADALSRIKIVPPLAFLEGTERYDLILNADSLTEMGWTTALAYWDQISLRADVFLSINHEANPFTVREIMGSSHCFASYDRRPYWMRGGYVEEIIRLRDGGFEN
jgi:hypothetical protein